jgi:hypothetical protein
MKTTILTLVAFLLLGTSSLFAQFSSSPVEPGLRDHLRSSSNGPIAVQDIAEKKMIINGVNAEWVSQDQITLSAVVIELNRLTDASRERIARSLLEYNVGGPVGTLTFDNGTVRLVHHLNPRYVSPEQVTKTVAVFKAAVEEQRKNLDRSMASR